MSGTENTVNSPASTSTPNGAKTIRSCFPAAVVEHRNHLGNLYNKPESGHYNFYPHSYSENRERIRNATPKLAALAIEHSLAGWTGLITGAAIFTAAWVAAQGNTGEVREDIYTAGGIAGFIAWVAIAVVLGRTVAGHRQELTAFGASLNVDINNAMRELRSQASALGEHGTEMLNAAEAMLPGIEELLDADTRLSLAIENSTQLHRGEYATRMVAARDEKRDLLLDITAELTAAAGVAFAARADLLVEMAENVEAQDVVLRASVLAPETVDALNRHRDALRTAAEQVI